jgi:hypothetical protein
MKHTIIILLIFLERSAQSQDLKNINPSLLSGSWSASWITCPDVAPRDYGIYHFRKKISLDKQPGKFIVHVSADNRYRLFVNGKAVCSGPARGDLYNWYFETIDLAPYLKTGTIPSLHWYGTWVCWRRWHRSLTRQLLYCRVMVLQKRSSIPAIHGKCFTILLIRPVP